MTHEEIKQDMMSVMRREFMPRESLDITFSHLRNKLDKIEQNLQSLPGELANEFEKRFGDRILKLEKEVEELKAFRWKMGGLLLAAQSVVAFVLERYLGH